MSISKRLEALEKAVPSGDILLYTKNGIQVDATITRRPTPDRPGEAQVADGTARPIEYDPSWKDKRIVVRDKKDVDDGGALLMRLSDAMTVIIHGIPRPEENAGSF